MTQSSPPKVSVLTFTTGRHFHLMRMLQGLENSQLRPHELIIVRLEENPRPIPLGGFPAKVIRFPSFSESNPPFSAARNLAASHASGDAIVFLGSDCIPGASMLSHLATAITEEDRLWSGAVRYMQEILSPSLSLPPPEELDIRSLPGSIYPDLTNGARVTCRHPDHFRSSIFGMRKETFEKIGGFDEAFTGYGGEISDFVLRADSLGIPLGHVGTKAWHQWHYAPRIPVHYAESIVKNANRVYEKWGHWPMENWLKAFAEFGCAEFNDSLNRWEFSG